jgi:hypothetical protein
MGALSSDVSFMNDSLISQLAFLAGLSLLRACPTSTSKMVVSICDSLDEV